MQTGLLIMTQRKSNSLHKSYKELSIQLGLSGLSFCILDRSTKEIQSLDNIDLVDSTIPEDLISHLDNWFDKPENNGLTFDKVIAIHENELSTVVPKPLFNESNLSDYLKYNVKILENDYLSFDAIPQHEIYNVYVPFTNVNNYLFEKFGDFEYKHASSILIETLVNQAKKGDEPTLYVYISKTHFEIIAIRQKQLLLYNTFNYQQKEDFIYYLLFTIEQLNLNPESVAVYLLGQIDKESDLYQIAYQYIQNVHIGNDLPALKNFEKHLNTEDRLKSMIILNSF